MKNKKILIILLVIIGLILSALLCWWLTSSMNYLTVDKNKISIRSTIGHNLEKNDIKVENIDIRIFGEQLQIKTTLRNTSKNDIEGYYIEIEFLDENGKVVTLIANNSVEAIKAGKTTELLNFAEIGKNYSKIVDAKIATFEKRIQDSIEDEIHELHSESEAMK